MPIKQQALIQKKKIIFTLLAGLLIGFLIGGYHFTNIQARSFLAIKKCDHCWRSNEIAGLLTAVGIAQAPRVLPSIVKETEYSVAIEHPFPEYPTHIVVFPKRDIKDIADMTPADQPYIVDAMNVIGEFVREKKLDKYKVITNGPGNQSVRYLHFHLVAE